MPYKDPKKRREYSRQYAKKYYHKNKHIWQEKRKRNKEIISKFLKEYRKQHPCEKCGDDRWYVLEFHHKDPNEKEFNVTRWKSKTTSLKRVKKEIDKCLILCSNCHRELHFIEYGIV